VADLLDNKYDSSRHCSKPTLTIKQDRLTALYELIPAAMANFC
jgi:hypothetical protein